MTEQEAKEALHKSLLGKSVNDPESAMVVLDTIWQAALEWARSEQEPVGWMYEDDLPDDYPYDELFPYSQVHEVRMFPVYSPSPAVAVHEWKPIETAPKDELILIGPTKRMGICVAMNHSKEGWVTETPSEFVSIYTPVCWMPLPPPPKEQP